MSEAQERLGNALLSRRAKVGVIGLGYVGLPLALALGESGFEVLGFDLDPAKTEALNKGRSYLDDHASERVRVLADTKKLVATTDLGRLGEADAILICVPTPLGSQKAPDLQFVEATARAVADTLRPGQLVILESTTYPGTTEEIVQPILEASGLVCEQDFFLAYSPEREDPGRADHGLASTPKVVGGIGPHSLDLAVSLYRNIVPETVPVSSPRVAEASKLTENIFRAVNIALANELKTVYDGMGIDTWEVLDAAATKPFGFMRFNPGPGWGGHCIPIDPFYLAWKARQSGTEARFVELAGEINTMMPRFVLDKLAAGLEAAGRQLEGARVLLLGLAYKPNVSDPRESPAFEFLELLRQRGALAEYHDPHISKTPRMRQWSDLEPLESQALTAEALASYDAVVLITDHDAIDYELVAEHARLIVDTRGRFRPATSKVISA